MAFGDDAIALVTSGLKRDTGSFSERLVSHGLIGDITTSISTAIRDLIQMGIIAFLR